MKKESINVLGKVLLIAMAFGMLCPLIAHAAESTEAKVDRLESQLKVLQADIKALKTTGTGASDFRVFWKEGLRFESGDENFKLKLGGRIYNDWGWMKQDSNIKNHTKLDGTSIGDQKDGAEFRTTRLYISGTVYENVDFKVQFDFASTANKFKDVYIGIRDLPFGYLKMGHFKEPFSLEYLTSSKYVTFMERGLPVQAFSLGRNTGFMVSSTVHDKQMTWAAGIFRDTGDWGAGSSEGGYNLTGRITALPLYEDNGAKLLHVGAAYSFRNPDGTVAYDSQPEAHLAADFVETSTIRTDDVGLLGLECAWVDGPLSLQGEYMLASVNRSGTSSELTFDGFYLQSSYFLTGEHRKYNTSNGAFGRVKPRENYNYGKDGWGAWEVAARYSQLELSDSSIRGGRLEDLTLGLNWYLNPNMRMMWNYIRAHLDGVGSANLAVMRMQIDF